MCDAIGIDAPLPHELQSENRAAYQTYYSARSKEIVEQHFAEYQVLFGYEFEGEPGVTAA